MLIQGNGNYSIGDFDGIEFKEETGRRPCDVGPNFYATQSWANTETGNGKRVQAAWMRGSVFPGMPFSQQISFPCELTLRSTLDGLRVFREPISAVSKLHAKETKWSNQHLEAGETLDLAAKGDLYHLKAEVEIPEGAKLIFWLRGIPVIFSARSIESGHAPAALQGPVRQIEILLDRGSIETFVNKGEISSTRFVLPHEEGLRVTAEGGQATIKSLSLYAMKSIWPKATP